GSADLSIGDPRAGRHHGRLNGGDGRDPEGVQSMLQPRAGRGTAAPSEGLVRSKGTAIQQFPAASRKSGTYEHQAVRTTMWTRNGTQCQNLSTPHLRMAEGLFSLAHLRREMHARGRADLNP